jgi:predicted DNA-binding transcriptional regulator YafY
VTLPEVTRIGRVLDIIWRISNAPNYWTRKRLAEEFEVSERTITSDLELIRHRLRFDIQSERGRGYYFNSVPRLPAVAYSVPEALALVLAAQVARQFSGIPQHDLSSAVGRLTSAIPPELRAMVERVVAGGDGVSSPHREETLRLCSQAISAQQVVRIVYSAASRAGEESCREVDPYAVFPYGRSWHIVGYCHLRDDVRIFKVDRIRSVEVLPRTFALRDDFDLSAFLSSGWGLMRGIDAPVEEVVLRFRPPSARWVAEERWHGSQQTEWQPDGTMIFRVSIQVTPEFQRWVYHYGRDVEVLAPDHLRQWVRAEAAAVLERVGATSASVVDVGLNASSD